MASLEQTIEILFNATDNTGGAFGGITNKLSALDASIQGIAAPFASLADMILKTETAIAALGAAFVGVAISKAGAFGNSIAEISTVAGTTSENMARFSDQILTYSATSSKGISDINESIYQAVSAGIDYSNSLDFIKVAEDLAVGGRAQLSDSTNVLIESMNAYGISNKDAAEQLKVAGDYADIMFVAVQKGKIEIPELSMQLGDVTSTAASAGISFSDLNAAIAALTAYGIKGPQAVTSLNQAISNIVKPTKQASEAADEMGLAFDAKALKDEGLPTFMRNLAAATGGSNEKMNILFGSQEAVKSMLTLSTDAAGKFAIALDGMKERAGVASTAAKTMADAWENASQRLANAAEGSFIVFGRKLQDEASKGLGGLSAVFNAFTVSLNAGAFDPVFKYLNEQSAGLNQAFADIAKNLPEAMKGVDFSGLLGSFTGLGDSLKIAFESVFGQVDLTTPEGVQKVIQDVINGIQTLTEITTGIVDSFRPYLLALGDIIQRTEGLGTESNKQTGHVLGIAKAIRDFGLAVTGIAEALGDDKAGIGLFIDRLGGLVEGVANEFPLAILLIKDLGANIDIAGLSLAKLVTFGDAKIKIGIDLENAIADEQRLSGAIQETWEKSAAGYSRFNRTVQDATGETTTKVEDLGVATEKAADSSKKFEPIDLGGIDFIAEGMKRLGLNTDKAAAGAQAYSAEVSRIVLPDGMIKITDSLGNTTQQFDYSKKSAAGYFDTIKDASGNVIDHIWIPAQAKAAEAVKGTAAEMLKAKQAAEDYALKLLEAGNKVKIAGMETWGKINVAQIEADTKTVEAAFKSIDNTMTTTGKGISDLWGQFSKVSEFDQSDLLNSIRKQEKIQLDAAGKQNELLDAQIALMKARSDQIGRGDAVIRVEANGLKSHLELIFGEILKETQIKASEQGLQLLLGFAQ